MKNVLRDPIVKYVFGVAAILGLLVATNVNGNLFELYNHFFSSGIIYYPIITCAYVLSYILYKLMNKYHIVVRYKTIANYFFSMVKREILLISIFVIILHIPIILFCFNGFINNIYIIGYYCIYQVLFLETLCTLSRMLDLYIHKRFTVVVALIAIIAFGDFLLENILFAYITNSIFYFNYLFTFPLQNSNFICCIILVILNIIGNSFVILSAKRENLFLGGEDNEKI